MVLAAVAARSIDDAFEELGGDADHTEIVKLSEKATGMVLER